MCGSAFVEIPHGLFDVLTQEAPLVGGHDGVARRARGRCVVDLLHGLQRGGPGVAIALVRAFARAFLRTNHAAVEAAGGHMDGTVKLVGRRRRREAGRLSIGMLCAQYGVQRTCH
ncbi:hypothetical protein BURKHO8Y_170388 [Burkholderia sp. 8Y]|nr:hypothetical protein BURKHO8Y_170388 [Burkholderia sp. 8Y]